MARRLRLSGDDVRGLEAGTISINGDMAAAIVDRLLAIAS
jgi:hypothetical protein